MAKVIITNQLREKIFKKFKNKSADVFRLLFSLKDNPKKGKELTQINGVLIKEIRYESFRFYFLVDGYLLKIIDITKLVDILIKFIAMSDKKYQQETIDKIKDIVKKFGKDAMNEE